MSHEAYSTSQSSAAVRQITSESPLHPGKHVAATLGCSNIFWNNIVNIEWSRGEALLPEMSYMGVWNSKGLIFNLENIYYFCSGGPISLHHFPLDIWKSGGQLPYEKARNTRRKL